MAVTSNQISIGKDVSINIMDSNGNEVTLPLITGVHFTPVFSSTKVNPLNGPPIQFDLPMGHNINIQFTRQDNTLDVYFAQYESNFWQVGGFVPTFTIFATVTERNNKETTYQFTECTLQYKPGEFKEESAVNGTIEGYARYWSVT